MRVSNWPTLVRARCVVGGGCVTHTAGLSRYSSSAAQNTLKKVCRFYCRCWFFFDCARSCVARWPTFRYTLAPRLACCERLSLSLCAQPEMYDGNSFTVKSDSAYRAAARRRTDVLACAVYSFGVVCWEVTNRVATGESPIHPFASYAHIRHDFQIIAHVSRKSLRPPVADNLPEPVRQFIVRAWAQV